jgi:flagellar motor switch protein FliN/FliY
LASDISNIIKSEIVNTLENLLSASVNITNVELVSDSNIGDEQCIKVDSTFNMSGNDSNWLFFIPTASATKFEYLMLGGVTDLKDSIDDEISDAVKEIIATICGSIVTTVNGQGFDDVSDVKFELKSNSVAQCSDLGDVSNLYNFNIKINDDDLNIFISFDDTSKPFVAQLTNAAPSVDTSTASNSIIPNNSVLSSLLGEESVDNLRLLFDIKLRLSVRLGSKVCLLRDVISWDIGEIIELSQMTNEPLDILVNGVVVGQGEAIVVDGKFGVKIKYIGEPKLD